MRTTNFSNVYDLQRFREARQINVSLTGSVDYCRYRVEELISARQLGQQRRRARERAERENRPAGERERARELADRLGRPVTFDDGSGIPGCAYPRRDEQGRVKS